MGDTGTDTLTQSQARAAKAVNQEQLALYFGIGRYISENTRNKNWGTGAIDNISKQLRQELPGLRGFGASNLKNMRLFYEAWYMIEPNSPIAIGELNEKTTEYAKETAEQVDSQVQQGQVTVSTNVGWGSGDDRG